MDNRTYSPKRSEIEHSWHVIDAEGKTLGRLSSEVARLLTGKHKPTWTPHMDTGDFVIVVNAEKVVLTGRKEELKIYYRSTTRPGSLKSEAAGKLRQRRPVKMVEGAIRGMLPHTKLGRRQYTKLKVYAGPDHPHRAQQPQPYELVG